VVPHPLPERPRRLQQQKEEERNTEVGQKVEKVKGAEVPTKCVACAGSSRLQVRTDERALLIGLFLRKL